MDSYEDIMQGQNTNRSQNGRGQPKLSEDRQNVSTKAN
jgi:hypothetical protein